MKKTVQRRKRTGTIEPATPWPDGTPRFRFRIRLADGTKSKRRDVPRGMNEEQARAWVGGIQAEEDARGGMLAMKRDAERERARAAGVVSEGETADAWFERAHAYAATLGHTDIQTKRSRWFKWISPRIGERPIASITRDDIEDIRDALDAAVHAWQQDGRAADRVSGKTAMNVWSCLTSSFKAATSSKRRDLRVLSVNPCIGVEPPGDRHSRKVRRKTFLYPREASLLFACADVPLVWREVYAVATMSYLRPGELRVLTVGDIDFDANVVRVTKAWNYAEETTKLPKTRNGVRQVPIESSLLPLLRRLCDERERDALVVPIMSTIPENALADRLREDLLTANVRRAELHTSTLTHAHANFRSTRDTGLTWLAMTGLGVDKIMRRAGHDHIQTTMGYVKLAEDLGGTLGQPFAPLPDDLLRGSVGQSLAHSHAIVAESQRRARDSNPWYPCRYT